MRISNDDYFEMERCIHKYGPPCITAMFQSGTMFLEKQFSAEHLVPVSLPYHPNVVQLLHCYNGTTVPFKRYVLRDYLIWLSRDSLIWLSRDSLIWLSRDSLIWLSRDFLILLSRDSLIWLSRDSLILLSRNYLIWRSRVSLILISRDFFIQVPPPAGSSGVRCGCGHGI